MFEVFANDVFEDIEGVPTHVGVDISWLPSESTDEYHVYRSLPGSGTFELMIVLGSDVLEWRTDFLESATYRIMTWNPCATVYAPGLSEVDYTPPP